MARVLVTGSADGLGRAAALELLESGHHVFVHARSAARLAAVKPLVNRGAVPVIGDLSVLDETRELARQVNALGRMDAIIHNAGVYSDASVLIVNVLSPFILTASLERPARLVYLSSGMHQGGRPSLEGLDWTGRRATGSYSDSKLFISTLAAAIARRWPTVLSNSVNPGWVPTKMGGPNAPDDLELGHRTQVWLATSEEPEAKTSGGYWFHQRREPAHPAVTDHAFQDRLVETLSRATGLSLD